MEFGAAKVIYKKRHETKQASNPAMVQLCAVSEAGRRFSGIASRQAAETQVFPITGIGYSQDICAVVSWRCMTHMTPLILESLCKSRGGQCRASGNESCQTTTCQIFQVSTYILLTTLYIHQQASLTPTYIKYDPLPLQLPTSIPVGRLTRGKAQQP